MIKLQVRKIVVIRIKLATFEKSFFCIYTLPGDVATVDSHIVDNNAAVHATLTRRFLCAYTFKAEQFTAIKYVGNLSLVNSSSSQLTLK